MLLQTMTIQRMSPKSQYQELQKQVDAKTATKRSQALNIEEEKTDVYSSKRANHQSRISRY